MIIVDSSGWIEFFFEKANAYCFAESIEDSGNLLVPVISIYEVFKKILLTTDEARAFQAVVQMKQGRVVELTEEIALKAAVVSIDHNLPLADSIIYATGLIENALILTQDADFESLPGVKYFPKQAKDVSDG